MAHAPMDNKQGLVSDFRLTAAVGTEEQDAAPCQVTAKT